MMIAKLKCTRIIGIGTLLFLLFLSTFYVLLSTPVFAQAPSGVRLEVSADAVDPSSMNARVEATSSSGVNLDVFGYLWDFGDGTTQNTSTPSASHTYTTPGTYDVTVGMSSTIDSTVIFVLGPKEFEARTTTDGLSFSVTPRRGDSLVVDAQVLAQARSAVNLDDYDYSWRFGDGTSTTTSEPFATHTYTSSGTYEVSVFMAHESDIGTIIDFAPRSVTVSSGDDPRGDPTPTTSPPTPQDSESLVPCRDDCSFEHFIELVQNVLSFLMRFALVVATVMFVYAGFLFVTNNGDTGRLDKGKKIFKNVFIGIVIVVAAWLIVNTLLGLLLSDEYKRAVQEIRQFESE